MHLVLINRLGSLSRNSVVRLTDRLDMTIVVDWDYSDGTLHYPAEVSWFVSSDSRPSPDMLLYHKNEKPAWASVTTHFLRQINVSVMDDLPYMICECLTPNLNQNEYCRK